MVVVDVGLVADVVVAELVDEALVVALGHGEGGVEVDGDVELVVFGVVDAQVGHLESLGTLVVAVGQIHHAVVLLPGVRLGDVELVRVAVLVVLGPGGVDEVEDIVDEESQIAQRADDGTGVEVLGVAEGQVVLVVATGLGPHDVAVEVGVGDHPALGLVALGGEAALVGTPEERLPQTVGMRLLDADAEPIGELLVLLPDDVEILLNHMFGRRLRQHIEAVDDQDEIVLIALLLELVQVPGDDAQLGDVGGMGVELALSLVSDDDGRGVAVGHGGRRGGAQRRLDVGRREEVVDFGCVARERVLAGRVGVGVLERRHVRNITSLGEGVSIDGVETGGRA